MKTNTSYMTGSLIALLVMIFSLSGFSTKWVVMVSNFQFTPSSLSNVSPGDTIRWEWASGTHTTTSSSVPAGALTWDQPIDASNTVYEYHATVTGTYNYFCMHHPSMVASFTVTDFVPTLTVTPSNQNVTMPAGTTDFTVTSNTDWVAVSNSGWCTVTPSGTGNGTVTATYSDNASGPPRVATITVTVTGLTPQQVTVSQDGTTGVVENSANTLRLYPNPTTGIITVIPGESSGKVDDLTVMDITGRTLFSNVVSTGQQYNLDLSSYPGGYYFVRVTSDAGTLTRKVILDK
jgi:plastocyanin